MGYQESIIKVNDDKHACELASKLDRRFITPCEIIKTKRDFYHFKKGDTFLWVAGARSEQHSDGYVFMDDIFGWNNDTPIPNLFDIKERSPEFQAIKDKMQHPE